MTQPSTPLALFGKPFDRQARPLGWRIGALAVGVALLTAASSIAVPMVPVPITMQTFAVTMIGAVYGWRLGALTVLAWLGLGALGLPVFAGGGAGLHRLAGPSGGYLLAFPVAAALTGWLAERRWDGRNIGLAFAAMLLGNLVCLTLGAARLGVLIGWDQALTLGVLPFLVGALLKSALAAATLTAMARGRRSAQG